MKKLSTAKKIGVAVLALSAVGVGMQIQSAQAQYQGGGYSGFGYPPGGFSSGSASSPAITASGGYLFVMRGDVLYKIRQRDLRVERRLLFNGDPGLYGTTMPYPTPTTTPVPTVTPTASLGRDLGTGTSPPAAPQ